MHDPSTLAFSIRRPWADSDGYRPSWIDIWHEDPEDFEGKCGCRSDDSCGWYAPPMSLARHEMIKRVAKEQYPQIFEYQVRTREGAGYARICFIPSTYDAVYWLWRAIKHAERRGKGWQYGSHLSAGELDDIYTLSANPVDNVRTTVAGVQDLDEFERLTFIVDRAYRRFHRPWWRHPRWHIHHWRFRFPGVQPYWRWLFGERCKACGGRVGPIHEGEGWPVRSGAGLYHSHCIDRGAATVPRETT